METKHVLVVAVTDAYPGAVCVGAMATDGEPVRLVLRDFHHHFFPADRAPAPGAILDITGRHSNDLELPHVEDFVVDDWSEIRAIQDSEVARLVREWAVNHSADGRLLDTFDGRLTRIENSVVLLPGYTPPRFSVWFWTADQEIPIRKDARGGVHAYVETGRASNSQYDHPASVPMKSLDAGAWADQTIPGGALLRLSLGRPWKEGKPSDACWLQISGVLGMGPA